MTRKDVDKQMCLLLETRKETIPLDRGMGMEMSFLDRPAPAAKALFASETVEQVKKFIPEAGIREVQWLPGEDGILRPKVVFRIGDD